MADGGRKNADAALIAALATGATVRDAASDVGVGERTVYRRLDDPAFRRQVDDARAALIATAVARLGAASTKAVATLEGLLTADSEAVQLGAARAILDAALKWREHQDLTERVAVLEEQLQEAGPTVERGARRWGA